LGLGTLPEDTSTSTSSTSVLPFPSSPNRSSKDTANKGDSSTPAVGDGFTLPGVTGGSSWAQLQKSCGLLTWDIIKDIKSLPPQLFPDSYSIPRDKVGHHPPQ
jgi:hypothetical protein